LDKKVSLCLYSKPKRPVDEKQCLKIKPADNENLVVFFFIILLNHELLSSWFFVGILVLFCSLLSRVRFQSVQMLKKTQMNTPDYNKINREAIS